jgi:hypothetical protein
MKSFLRPGAFVALAIAQLLSAGLAPAQAVIKVNDDVSFKLGFLLQAQGDWTQSAANDSYSQNLFLRRVRVLVGGQVAKNVTFFFETDNPNLGKVVVPAGGTGAKVISSGLTVQDAFLSWKIADEFTIDAGLILTGIAHNSLQSAASLMPIDYGSQSFNYSGPEQNVVGRDTGFQARGYLAEKKLEYRVGVWQGNRDAASRQALRETVRLQYNFLDADTGFFYTGTSMGKKKIFAIGGGYDVQKDYTSYAADAYYDHPLGAGALSAQVDYIHYDGGTFLMNANGTPSLPKQDTFYGEAGYYISSAKVMPYFLVSNKDIANTDAGDDRRWAVGLGFFPFGHNFNIKAAYGQIDPKVGKTTSQFTVQMQAFYF